MTTRKTNQPARGGQPITREALKQTVIRHEQGRAPKPDQAQLEQAVEASVLYHVDRGDSLVAEAHQTLQQLASELPDADARGRLTLAIQKVKDAVGAYKEGFDFGPLFTEEGCGGGGPLFSDIPTPGPKPGPRPKPGQPKGAQKSGASRKRAGKK